MDERVAVAATCAALHVHSCVHVHVSLPNEANVGAHGIVHICGNHAASTMLHQPRCIDHAASTMLLASRPACAMLPLTMLPMGPTPHHQQPCSRCPRRFRP